MEPLAHLAIIWTAVFVAVFAAKKTKLTPVLYFLAVGAILVNVGVLPSEPGEFIRGFAEIGIVLIMFALGFEESTENFLQGIKRSWGIALFGAIAPFVTAYTVADYFWGETNLSIMCGLAMTATAVSLTMVSLKAEGLTQTPAATGIMTSAVLDDIGSLALVAILVPIATGDAAATPVDIAFIVSKAVLFFGIVMLIGSVILPHEPRGLAKRFPILQRFGITRVLSFAEGEHATLTVLLIAVVVGLIAHALGFHPAIGAYMAGLVIKEEYFHFHADPLKDHFENTKRIVDNVAFSWIGPVFFVDLGTKIIFDGDLFVSVIPQVAILTVGLIVAQITSAGLAAHYTGGFRREESVLIGLGMLGRAELAFVVLDIAYVQNSILSDEAFYTLMITAFWLNVAVPISISWWKPYYLGDKTLFGRPKTATARSVDPPDGTNNEDTRSE